MKALGIHASEDVKTSISFHSEQVTQYYFAVLEYTKIRAARGLDDYETWVTFSCLH